MEEFGLVSDRTDRQPSPGPPHNRSSTALGVPDVPTRYGEPIRHAFAYLELWRWPPGSLLSELPPAEEQGWPLYEGEPTPVTEITCWVLIAYAQALRFKTVWQSDARERVEAFLAAAVAPLLRFSALHQDVTPTAVFARQRPCAPQTSGPILRQWPCGLSLNCCRWFVRTCPWVCSTMPWTLSTTAQGGFSGRGTETMDGCPIRLATTGRDILAWARQVLFILTLLRQSTLNVTLPPGYLPALDDFLSEAVRLFPEWEFDTHSHNLRSTLAM